MERTTIREAHGGRRHSALLEATPAVMPRACLLVIGRAFLVLDARVGQWRENTLVLTVPTPLRILPQLIYTVSHSTVARHEKLRQVTTRPSLVNVSSPLFFLNHRSRFSLPGKKGRGGKGAKMRTKVAFSAVAMHKFSPRSRAFGLKGNREAPSGIQESEHRWMRRGGMLFNIPFWSRPFSRSRVPTEPRKRKRVRECEGKRNALE